MVKVLSAMLISNKKIVAVCSSSLESFGGIATYIRSITYGMKSLGYEVHCITTNSLGDAYEMFCSNFTCHDLSKVKLSYAKVYSAASLLNKIQPDILLLNHCSLFHYALPLINCKTKPIVVLHSDDSKFYETASLFSKRIFRWVSPTPKVEMAFRGYLEESQHSAIKVIPHGVDNNIFDVSSSRINENPVVTFIGYIAENKGADLLPSILQRIISRHSNVRLNVVGYGPLTESLKTDIEQLSLERHCVFTGPLPPEKVADLLSQTDILLLPTRIEGFGLAIVEAMMCGAVPVVTRLVGITDSIINDNVSGFLVKQNDVDAFASVIANLLDNAGRLSEMSCKAREIAKKHYSLQTMISNYQSLFSEEDERSALPKRGIIGWGWETIRELIAKNPDGTRRLTSRVNTLKRVMRVVK